MTKDSIEAILCVGVSVFIDVDSERSAPKRTRSKIRGWVPGQYLLMDLPATSEEAAFILKDAACVLRFVHEGAAVGFDTKILDWCDMGLPFFRVRWPSNVQTIHVRKHTRIPMHIPCRIAWQDGEEECELQDLSVAGCGLTVRRILKDGSVVRISFTLPDGSPLHDVRATVCRSRPQGERVFVGCQFLEDARGDRDPLVFYMSTTLSRMGIEPLADRRVLVLHDALTNIKPLAKAFDRAGVHMIAAKGPVEGFYRLRMAPPACLLVDVQQPRFSSADLCEAVHQTPGFENIPVFLFGDADNIDILKKQCKAVDWFALERIQQEGDSVVATCLAASVTESGAARNAVTAVSKAHAPLRM